MKQIAFNQIINQPIVIALGFFDCIHLGHQEIIKQAKSLCTKDDACTVFTFNNNPFDLLNNKTKLIFTYFERLDKLEELGVDYCISANFDSSFMNMPGNDFLDMLFKNNIKAIVCGHDYSYGKQRLLVNDLISYANKNNITVKIVDDVNYKGERASSTLIRNYLSKGDIANANMCLGGNYFIKSVVESGHKIGRQLSFPTANIVIPSDKLLLANGVYSGITIIGNDKYPCIINIGSRPTYNDISIKVEVHIINFHADLYNQTIKVEFTKFLRNIIKFDNPEQLKNQLERDKKAALL